MYGTFGKPLPSGGRKKLSRYLTTTVCIRELEPRIAFDGAMVAIGAEVIPDLMLDGIEPVQASETEAASTVNNESLSAALADLPGETGAFSQIVFVDSAIEDLDTLIGSINPAHEIVLLDANRDGVDWIAEILSSRSSVDAIHIVSHGDQGELFLGTGHLTLESMNGEYADDGNNVDSMINCADSAMYRAKNSGEVFAMFANEEEAIMGAEGRHDALQMA